MRRVGAAAVVISSVLSGLVFAPLAVAAPKRPMLSDPELNLVVSAPSVLAESTRVFDPGATASPLVAADPVRLEGGTLVAGSDRLVGAESKGAATPVAVQVLRPVEVTAPAVAAAAGGLASDAKPVSPVSLPATAGLDGVPVGELSVTVLSTDEAMRAGFDGLAFYVDAPDALLTAARSPTWVRFEIDWSQLRTNYGAEWQSRLQLVALNSCWLKTATKSPGCGDRMSVLPSVVNDVERQVLVVEVDLAEVARTVDVPSAGFGESRAYSSGNGGPGFGLSAGASSQYGNFAATSLGFDQRWSVSGNTGGFSWSYPISGPPTPGGAVSTSLNYSSQAVDGMTADENTQGGQIGVGWSMPSSFIERRYKTCTNGSPCWDTENAVLSLNGQSGELVKDANGSWHLENDPGWRITRFESSTQTQGSVGVDGNKEYWVVTTQDGTQYWFGFGKEKGTSADTPGSAGDPGTTTKSVWTEPVYGAVSGQPCYTLSGHWCHQAYRWMLDRVVTATGVQTTYFYDTHINTFGRGGAPANATKYVAGGELVRIEYGQLWADADVANRHPAKIEFSYVWRCTSLDSSCPQPTSSNGSQFPDIPNDEICGEFATWCTKYAPTFFDWKALTAVTTYRLVNTSSAAAYHTVDEYKLTLNWVDNDDEDAYNTNKLWLRSIERIGWQGYNSTLTAQTSLSMQKVWFDSSQAARLPNRSDDVLPTVVKQKYYRVSIITDEIGGRTVVDYSDEDSTCDGVSSGWDTNTRRCYARYYNPSSGSPGFARWNKYVVDSVTYEDLARSQPSVTVYYTYDSAGMAWAHNDDPMAPAGTTAWDEYRGYGWVQSTVGTGNAVARTYYFRGMHGDKLGTSSTKTVNLTNSIGEAVADSEWLAGSPYETQTRLGSTIKSRTFTEYTITRSITGTAGNGTIGGTNTARRIGTTITRTNRTEAGTWTKQQTNYNSTGQVIEQIDYGIVTDATGSNPSTSEDTCATTLYTNAATYTDQAARFIEGLTRAQFSVTGATCPSAGNYAYISSTNWYYDGHTSMTIAPEAGLNTKTVTDVDPNNTEVTTYTEYEHDGFNGTPGYARPTTATDGRGKVTTTTYTPMTAGVITNRNNLTVTVTAPISSHTSSTYFDNFGRAWKTTDPNNRSDISCFDELGRLTRIYLSDVTYTNCTSGTPNITYAYVATTVSASPRASVDWTVQTRTLFATASDAYNPTATPGPAVDIYVESWTFLDGLGRSVQSQILSPVSGRVVTRTKYDDAGQAVQQSTPYNVTGTTFTYDTSPDATNGLRDTVTTYDQFGRITAVRQKYGNGTSVLTAHQTYTTYNDTLLTTTAHVTGSGTSTTGATVTTIDALGRTIKVTKNDNSGSNTDTTYSWRYSYPTGSPNTRYGLETTVTDPQGNQTITQQNWIGQTTSTDDPNAGYHTTTYNPTGQVECVTDAIGQLRFYEYDDLGRPTFEHIASQEDACNDADRTNWPLLTAWTYDPYLGGYGATATAISYDGTGNAQVTATVPTGAFDARGRLTKTTVQVNAADNPDTAHPEDDFLDTAFTTEQLYTRDDQIWQTIYPAMNFGTGITTNLEDPETAAASFNTLGMPIGSTSDYDGGFTYVASTTYDPTGRITGRTMGGTGSTYGLTRTYTYQASDGIVSNLTANSITPPTSQNPTTTLIQNDTYTYDAVGNPARIRHNPVGTTNDETECFQYDARQRLTRGYTLAGGNTTCTPPTTPTGPAPYDESYTFNPLDQFLTNGSTTSTRQYDTTGSTPAGTCTADTNSTKPHATAYITAPGSTSTTSGHEYTYNCNGSTTKDIDHTTNPATSTDHYWDAHNRLESTIVAQPGQPAVTQTNIYDASGQRALRTVEVSGGATTKTITIGAIQYQWTSVAPNAVNSVRSYAGAQRGDLTAGGDACTWTSTNLQASITTTVNSTTGGTSVLRYSPYGSLRSGLLVNNFGFLGQITDAVVDLAYLNARYYDPEVGIFTSVDPLVESTATPYLYGAGSPVTYSDPSGLCIGSRVGGYSVHEGPGCGADRGGSAGLNDEDPMCWDSDRNCTHPDKSPHYTGGGLFDFLEFVGGFIPVIGEAIDAYHCIVDGDALACAMALVPGASSAAGQVLDTVGRHADEAIDAARAVDNVADSGGEALRLTDEAMDATNSVDDFLGAACRSNSFVPGTQVLMADGTTKGIEDVEVGDRVRAADPESGVEGGRAVTDVILGDGRKDLVEVVITGNGVERAIVATAKHPFWVAGDRRWVDATDLTAGDRLLEADGSTTTVVSTREFAAVRRVHNLTVDGIHTYFVVAGGESVLVHNCGSLDDLSRAAAAPDRNGLTAAGRAAQKHASRPGSAIPTPSSTTASGYNELGQTLVDDLLTAPSTAVQTWNHPSFGQVTDFWGPSYGVRYGPNGEFIGFLDP